jgi:aminopeptidase YwaD
MKFKKLFIFLIICLLAVNQPVYANDSFNTTNVYSTIKELSSDKYAGRLAGDKGNMLATEYIANYFKNLKLLPGGENKTYFQSFEVYVPTLSGKCYFKIYDLNGKLVKEYQYGTDFKELPYGASRPGIVSGMLKFDEKSTGSILLIRDGSIGESTSDYELDLNLKKDGVNALIYPTNRTFKFRSPYKAQSGYSEGLVKIMASKNIIPELIDFSKKGYKFEIKSTLETKKVISKNVIAVLKGSDTTLPPIILSAHFDHVGYDADGTIYPGALDNASGTAFLLESARVLKNSPIPERTIIFAAFNAEEEGLIGSKYFVDNPTLNIKDAECINFDMVGASVNIPLAILSMQSKSQFSNTIAKIANSLSVKTKMLYEDNSDHASFCNSGFNSVTLIHDDVTKIHTPDDTIENIDKDKLTEVFLTLDSYLKSKDIVMASTSPSQVFPGDRYVLVFVLIGSFLFLSVYYYTKKRVNISR